jgi:hypothetical protein
VRVSLKWRAVELNEEIPFMNTIVVVDQHALDLPRDARRRGIEGQMRSLRFNLQHAMEDVDNQFALLRSKVAILNSHKTSLAKAQGTAAVEKQAGIVAGLL